MSWLLDVTGAVGHSMLYNTWLWLDEVNYMVQSAHMHHVLCLLLHMVAMVQVCCCHQELACHVSSACSLCTAAAPAPAAKSVPKLLLSVLCRASTAVQLASAFLSSSHIPQ